MTFFESGALRSAYANMDAAAYGRLTVITILSAWTSCTSFMVIGRLSALTHQILGQFKMCCLLLGSYLLLGSNLNSTQLTGASVTMLSVRSVFFPQARKTRAARRSSRTRASRSSSGPTSRSGRAGTPPTASPSSR